MRDRQTDRDWGTDKQDITWQGLWSNRQTNTSKLTLLARAALLSLVMLWVGLVMELLMELEEGFFGSL